MLIQCSGTSAKLISQALLAPVGTQDPNGFLVWTTPTQAKAALAVSGVTSAAELPTTARYPPAPSKPVSPAAQSTVFQVLVAPFCLYEDPDDLAVMAGTAPLTVAQVGDALVALAAANGKTGATAKSGSHFVTLTFPTPQGANLLPTLAAHPQVRWIEMASQFVVPPSPPNPPNPPTNLTVH